MKISIIIPAYNESTNIKNGTLQKVIDYMKTQSNLEYEVLVVDDGSKDDTVDLVENLIKDQIHFKLIKNPHGGKAITVMTGLLKSVGDIALFIDMDQATPISEIHQLLPKFKQGYDLVIGSRKDRRGAPLVRKIMAKGFAILRGIILGLPFNDTQCGLKAFSRESINDIFPGMLSDWQKMKSNKAAVNAGFDVETLFIAKKKGYKIAEVPVEWHHVGTERVQAISDSVEALKDMLRIRAASLSGKYN